MTGAASLVTSVADYAKWLKAFLSHSAPLSINDYKELKTPRALLVKQPQASPFSGYATYALGWEVDFYHGYQVFCHTGNIEAYGCRVTFVPELHWGAVTCANNPVASSYAGTELIQYLFDNKIRLAKEEKFDWFH